MPTYPPYDRFPITRDAVPDQPLFQYMDGLGLIGIVTNGEVWASDVRSMNDTGELEHGLRIIREQADPLAATPQAKALLGRVLDIADRLSSPVCAACFSAQSDVLSQW